MQCVGTPTVMPEKYGSMKIGVRAMGSLPFKVAHSPSIKTDVHLSVFYSTRVRRPVTIHTVFFFATRTPCVWRTKL